MKQAAYLWCAITQVTMKRIRCSRVILLCEAKVDEDRDVGSREQDVCGPLGVIEMASQFLETPRGMTCALLNIVVDDTVPMEMFYTGKKRTEPVPRKVFRHLNRDETRMVCPEDILE